LHVIPAQAGIQHHLPINWGGLHLGSGFRRSDEYTATGLFDAFDMGLRPGGQAEATI